MAVNKEFFLTRPVFFRQAFETLVKALRFLFIYLKYRALKVDLFSSAQYIRFEFFYHHCRRKCPVFKTDIILFAAFETAAYIIIGTQTSPSLSLSRKHIKSSPPTFP